MIVQTDLSAIQRVRELLATRITERCGTTYTCPEILLEITPGIGVEGFRIDELPDGAIRIAGNDALGLLHGAGHFLHTSRYAQGVFTPSAWRGVSVPDCPVRGIYFALHNNFYSRAPRAELYRYMEDLALWGINAVVFHLPQPEHPETPEGQAVLADNHALVQTAKNTGLKVGLLNSINIGFASAPPEILAAEFPDTDPARRGFADVRVCPSTPAGFAYLSSLLDAYLAGYEDIGIDFAVAFPYDSGGCGCAECWPWGARGYLTIAKEFARLARKRYPEVQFVLGTWCYDVREESDGEYDGLARELAVEKRWVQYLMIDSHYDFPSYPLEQGVPGGLPMINFAEISMWGRFPWGAYGANPLPEHFQRIWEQAGEQLAGGFPYSEGKFEDINKVIFARFFWDRHASAAQTVRDYIAYEYAPEVVEPVAAAIALLERAWPRDTWQRADVEQAFALLQQADAQLPAYARTGWRWRLLYLRALTDYELITHNGELTDAADAAYEELTDLQHVRDGWQCVAPRTRRLLAQMAAEQTVEQRPPGAD